MFTPADNYTNLASGVILMSASSFVISKVCKGSQSKFAYVLMALTFIDGAIDFALFFILVYLHPVIVRGQTYQVFNIYAFETALYCYYMVSLQSWIFGMKYLESAMLCSLTSPCISPLKVRYINWTCILIYTIVMLAMFIWCILSFPGFGSLD